MTIEETIKALEEIKKEIAEDIVKNNPEKGIKAALRTAGNINIYKPLKDRKAVLADMAFEKGWLCGNSWKERIVKVFVNAW